MYHTLDGKLEGNDTETPSQKFLKKVKKKITRNQPTSQSIWFKNSFHAMRCNIRRMKYADLKQSLRKLKISETIYCTKVLQIMLNLNFYVQLSKLRYQTK